MRHFADSFALAPDAQLVLAELQPDFPHLSRARIACIHSQRVILDRSRPARAQILIPAQLSGKAIERSFHEWALAQLCSPLYGGELPDFVLYLDAALWTASSPLEREQLLFHELAHIQQRHDAYDAPKFERDGRPSLHIAAHDAELFFDELKRYGPVVPAFDDTALAIADGTHATARRLRRA